jgi:hypothetical protein
VHVAYLLQSRFPDGQLFLNLRGYSSNPPVRPVEALPRFLRALGVNPDRISIDVDEQSALLRSTLSGRRVLLVLDNATGPDQVRPLLPGNGTCAVIVTSRDSLHGLSAVNGAHREPVDVVTEAEAGALLSAIIGAGRTAAEPAAAAELAALCGLLPLALRIAASNLAAMPGQPIADYVRELRSVDRVAAFTIDGDDEAALQAAFDLSYHALKPEAARLFRLLGLVPGPDFDRYAAANLAGLHPAEAGRMLAALTNVNLLQHYRAGRYQLHDLIRDYARGKAHAQDGAQACAAAARRLFDFYLHATDAASLLLYPDLPRLPRPRPHPDPDPDCPAWAAPLDALGWLDAEAMNLAAAQDETLQASGVPAWLLADALLGYVLRQGHDATWLTISPRRWRLHGGPGTCGPRPHFSAASAGCTSSATSIPRPASGTCGRRLCAGSSMTRAVRGATSSVLARSPSNSRSTPRRCTAPRRRCGCCAATPTGPTRQRR